MKRVAQIKWGVYTWEQAYGLTMDSSMKWRTESLGRHQYIDHLIIQVRKAVHKAKRLAEEAEKLLKQVNLVGSYEQQLLNFLENVRGQYNQIMFFYEENLNVLKKP